MTLVVGLLAVVFLMTIGALLDAERDTIMFRPHQSWFPKSRYWTERRSWSKYNLFTRTVIASFGDGWHLCKSLYIICYAIPIGYLITVIIGIPDYWTGIIGIATVLYKGMIFELTYGK